MSARYALYLAPPPDSELWRFGSSVIGRDAFTGEDLPGFAPEGWSAPDWRAATEEPRRYGFHATLKAPLRLADGVDAATLGAAVEALARAVAPFDLGALQAAWLPASAGRGFVALTPEATAPGRAELAALESRAVRELDPFRAPLGAAERAKRAPERLTARQREHLDRFGYPYVLDEFRLHFTLSGPVAQPDAVAQALAQDYRRRVASARFRVDALVLFEQAETDGPFRIVRRLPLTGEART